MRIKQTTGIGDGGKRGYLFDAVAVSDTTAHKSALIDLTKYDGAGFQLITTGTLAGTTPWKVYQSLNYSEGGPDITPNAGTWNDITDLLNKPQDAVLTGGSDQFRQLGGGVTAGCTTFFGGWIYVEFKASSGSGTVTAICLGKSLGS
jgi:hypothetical protein